MTEQTPTSPPRRLLVVSATVGSGHNSAARALIAQFAQAAPHIQCEFVDALRFAPRPFRAYYAGGFALSMTRFPWFYGLGFALSDHPQQPGRGLGERFRLAWERLWMKRFRSYLLAERFDAILHTHFLAPPLVARLIDRGQIHVPQYVAITDVQVHRFWYSRNVRHWFVPSEHSAEPLVRWGIKPEQITVSGIAIHPKWTAPLDKARILADWNLPAERNIVLLAGGTEFTCGPIVRIARTIVSRCPQAYVVVLAGRNKKLLAELAKLPQSPGKLVGMGFTDRAHELAAFSSIMATKPGGITTAECLAKGLPMVLINPVPGQEGGNARYFVRNGAAVIARRPRQIAAEVCRLLDDPPRLAQLADNARRLYRPAAETIVSRIVDELG